MTSRLILNILAFSGFLFNALDSNAQKGKKVSLFQPDQQKEWYLFLDKTGKNNDPSKVFQFEGETLHVSGQELGYICTEKIFGDFHLVFEFKWGDKRYPPRETEKRDGGVLYCAQTYSSDKVWPVSIECQVQEGDCGDFWMVGGSQIIHHDTLTTPSGSKRADKFKDAEKPKGEWNKVEVIFVNGSIKHLINGVLVNEGRDASLRRGRILLQSEWAEIYYRNASVEEM